MKQMLTDIKKILKTPPGETKWAHFITPNTKFISAGVWETFLKFDSEREKQFLAQVEEPYEDAYRQVCKEKFQSELPRGTPPWKRDKDNRLMVKFKLKVGGVVDGEPWTNKPPKLFDAAGRLIKDPDPDELKIGNGSIVRVCFQVRSFFVQKVWVTFRLKAVQLIKVVTYDDVKYFGLEDEDNGDGCYRIDAKAASPKTNGGAAAAKIDPDELANDEEKFAPIADGREITDDDDDVPF